MTRNKIVLSYPPDLDGEQHIFAERIDQKVIHFDFVTAIQDQETDEQVLLRIARDIIRQLHPVTTQQPEYHPVQHGLKCSEAIVNGLHLSAWLTIHQLRAICLTNAVDYNVENFNAALNDLLAQHVIKQEGLRYMIS